MGFNVSGGQGQKPPAQVVLDEFGGLVINMAPQDLPAGASPDNADICSTPGGVTSRPAFKKVFREPLYPASQRTYGETFVANDGTIRNLYFYTNGAITVENVSTAPGIETLLSQTAARNCCAKSVTAFGRAYIAISDGLHGQEVPLQLAYDASGNPQLDRFTQDGPGATPTVQSFILPAVAMLGGAPVTLAVVSIETSGETTPGLYTTITVTVTAGASAIVNGTPITIAGSTYSGFDGLYYAIGAQSDTQFTLVFYSSTAQAGTGGTATIGPPATTTMSRAGNLVTVKTAAPHNLQPGYQAQITGVPAAGGVTDPVNTSGLGGPITSIVINNEDSPGLATITTTTPHGLTPQSQVSISDVLGETAGDAGSLTASRQGGVVTFTSAARPFDVIPGASITASGFGDTTFNFSGFVVQVVDPFNFTVLQNDVTNATTTGGTIYLNWPIPDTTTPQYFEVDSAPTPTTFTVQLSYCDGTWASGRVSLAWNGIFFVLGVPAPNIFTYTQYGPQTYTTAVGTVTPFGQAAPGLHQMQVSFLDRQGGISSPSPPVKFETNGGQFLQISALPIGPSNIAARILQFTGAGGAQFFYIPVPAQVNGQVVSTATQINDNTTTSVVLDFSDPTLFSAIGVSIPGNNVADQIVLESALSFGEFSERLLAWGQRNIIQSGEGSGGLLDMGFDGGYLSNMGLASPAGWNASGTGGVLVPSEGLAPARPPGFAWQISLTADGLKRGQLSQGAYQDVYGDPIVSGNTLYGLRVFLQPSLIDSAVNFVAVLSSASTGFSSDAIINGSLMSLDGAFLEGSFSAFTPPSIPADLTLSIYATSENKVLTLAVDEITITYKEEPYLPGCYGAYVQNPAGIDGVSGLFGPDDQRPVMDCGINRGTLFLWTQDPGGNLYRVNNAATSEPAGWEVEQQASGCGLVSTFALAKSQANSNTESGGEEWFSWISSSGIRIFGGQSPMKLSQEIENGLAVNPFAGLCFTSLNPAAQLTCWALNDPQSRNMWFGIPAGSSTAPNLILVLNYIGLDSAEAIADSPAVRVSLTGKVIARDFTRKWTRWLRPMNNAALMYRTPSSTQPVFMGGATAAGDVFGNAYTLDPSSMTDDDYGVIHPYYVTCALPTTEQEQQFQIGSMMKVLAYLTASVNWHGNLLIQPYVNYLDQPWDISVTFPSPAPRRNDLEWGGGQATGQRFFIKLATFPFAGQTDNSFSVTRLIVALKDNARLPIRGSNS